MKNLLALYRDNQNRARHPLVANNAADGEIPEIFIYDVISSDPYWGVTAKMLIDQLNQLADEPELHIRINCPGGSVFEAQAMCAALKKFKGKTVAYIDSLAASAASWLALACNEVVMDSQAFFMIHNVSSVCYGDKNDLRKEADMVEKLEGICIAYYVAKTGLEEKKLIDWMNQETWFSAVEALAAGFIDRVSGGESVQNCAWNLGCFNRAPKVLTQEKPAVPSAAPESPAKGMPQDKRQVLLDLML